MGAGEFLRPGWRKFFGALLGASLGQIEQRPESLGLDAVFPAVLLALLLPAMRERRALLAAAVGTALSLAATPLLPVGLAPLLALSALLLVLPRRGMA